MNFRYITTVIAYFLLTFSGFSQGYADEVTEYRKSHHINTGKVKLTNETSKAITIFLYHSDTPNGVFCQTDLEVGESIYMKINGSPITIGSDWGYEISLQGQRAYGGENVLFVGDDASFTTEFNLKIGVAYGNWWEAPEETDDSDDKEDAIIDLLDYYDEEHSDEESCDYHTIAFRNDSGFDIKIWVNFVPKGKTAYETWMYRFEDGNYGVIGYTDMDFYWYAEETQAHSDGTYHQWKGDKFMHVIEQDFYMHEEKLEGRPCEETERIIW